MTDYTKPTIYTGDDISLNGITLNTVADNCKWIVTDLEGWWGLPDIDFKDDVRPYYADGSYEVNSRYTSRNIVLTGFIVPEQENPSGVPFTVAARDTLNRALQLVRSKAYLTVLESEAAKMATVQVVGRPLTRFSKMNDVLEFNIQLVAADPLKYAVSPSTAAIQLSSSVGGRTYRRTYNWSYYVAGTPNSTVLVNNGSFSTSLVATIYGLVRNPVIENVTTGQWVGFNTEVGEGQSLTVDFSSRVTTRSSGERAKNTLMPDSEWFELVPGNNIIRFQGIQPFTTTNNAVVQLDYRSAWID